MQRKIRTLQRRIEKIKSELSRLGELRPGSQSKQYNVCGNPNCKCKGTPQRNTAPITN